MADLADEVGDVMFWGDKGKANAATLSDADDFGHMNGAQYQDFELRHAGTSSTPLPQVEVGVLYI